MTNGERLKTWLFAKNITYEDFGATVGIPKRKVMRMCNNKLDRLDAKTYCRMRKAGYRGWNPEEDK